MKRSKFSLSHSHLFSCDMGNLIPCGLTEVLPGDSIQQNTLCMVRCSPLLAPVMHNCHVSISHWFVPNRLVWEDWEDFITGGPDGNDASVYPTITFASGLTAGVLANCLGVPIGGTGIPVSAIPFRGYSLIWNEWFRDQDLQTPLTIDLTSGPDTTTNVQLQRVCWEKDYFTSARPWEQKGPSITVPIGTTAPVTGIATSGTVPTIQTGASVRGVDGDTTYDFATGTLESGGAGMRFELDSDVEGTARPLVFADLSGASAVTVNVLREALALQRFEEARARFGSRYVEYLRYLGVRSSDARLQRPEFLGGGRYPLQFSEVLQTAEGTDPVGELRGHGIGVARSNRYRRFFEEHGYIFTMMYVRPKTIYLDGLFRHWNRRTKEDYFQKELQHIGQQEVLVKEVYGIGAGTADNVFGYQDRYDEYRRCESRVSGEFATTLNFWHFARDFTSAPALNSSFVSCVPTEVPFAVPSANVLYVMARHSIQARRIVAKKGSSFIY